MNRINVQNFIQQTEQYLESFEDELSPDELDNIIELYQDLHDELDSQQLFPDFYH